jgi:nucleoside-diphosphate-sugar epimerase
VRVLVTGATGFTGQAVVRDLVERGDTVYALRRPGAKLPDGVEPVDQDLTAPLGDGLPDAIDGVVHLAQSRRYREFPDGATDVFEVNANATVRLLAWARAAGAGSFVYASSGAIYAPGPEPVRETDAPAPGNFYAVSKLAGELACEQFRGELRAHVLRFFFIYGPGQENMFIPGVVGRIRDGQEVALAGEDGIRVNPVYVDDAARAVIGTLDAPESLTLNVAGPDTVSLRELSELAGEQIGREPRYTVGDPRPDVLASIDALRGAGLAPEVSFAEGLRRTVAATVSS